LLKSFAQLQRLRQLTDQWVHVTTELVDELEAIPGTAALADARLARERDTVQRLVEPILLRFQRACQRRFTRPLLPRQFNSQRVDLNYRIKNRVLVECRYALTRLIEDGDDPQRASYVLEQIALALPVEQIKDEDEASDLARTLNVV